MISVKSSIRSAVRVALGNARGDAFVDDVKDNVYGLAYRLDSRGRRSAQRLRALKDQFVGRRCFIIGNGPSLAAMDLGLLKDELTFGLNRGYLLFDRIGGPTTFLVAINHHVIDQFGPDLLQTPARAFLNWHSRDVVPADANATFLLGSSGPRFSEDVAKKGVWDGGTVTYVAMQLAFYFGFHEVVLIGVDHHFRASGQPRALVTSTEADVNHFDPRYFGPGVRWQLPDLETSELAYRLARAAFEREGRVILDATAGGRLSIFPKADYRELLGSPVESSSSE